ncbi:MAG: phospholipid carrier-dependent glycosyltransferase [Clostridia bacterium]|nr:phospholipid carrier-dependent glycosyltransferase [Clostridia bacterium]
MQRKSIIIAAAVFLVVLCIAFGIHFQSGRQVYETGNLIRNGDFTMGTGKTADDWETGMWVTSPGTSFLEVATLEDGTRAAFIENAGMNDARFEQTVPVAPDTLYRYSARVRAEGCGEGLGANLSFIGIYGTSSDLRDTDGRWETLTLYVQTGKNQHEATAAIRLGGYGSENIGKAWFTDVTLEAVEDAPIGASVLYIGPAESGNTEEKEPFSLKTQAVPVLTAVSLLWLFLSVWLILNGERAGISHRVLLPAVLVLAFLLRVILSTQISGYGVDIGCFSAWAAKMASGGPAGFYEEGYFCDYPPAYMLVLGILGTFINASGIGYAGMGIQIVLKMVPELCDVALAWMIYELFRREDKVQTGLVLASVFAFNPAYIITSSCWGQIDSVAAILIVIFLMQAKRGHWERAIPLFALAVLTKPQAGLLAPLGIFALIKAVREKEEKKPIGIGLILAVLVTALIAVPFSLRQTDPLWLVDRYVSTLGSYNFATLSTGNLMFLLGGNWVETGKTVFGPVTYGQLGTVLMIGSILAGILVYARSKGRKLLFLSSALTIQMIFVLGPKMHERYILAALVLMLIAFLETQDVRILVSFLLSSAVSAINIGVVLAYDYLIAPNLWLGYVIGAVQLISVCLMLCTAYALCRGREPVQLRVRMLSEPEDDAGTAGTAYEAHLQRALQPASEGPVPLTRRDAAIMLAITLVYAVIAFYDLGAMVNPQTGYISSSLGERVVIDLGDGIDSSAGYHIYYYGGISDTQFSFCSSDDPENFPDEERVEAFFNRGECFKWEAMRWPTKDETGQVTGASGDMLTFSGRYIEITFDGAGSALWEVAAVDEKGTVIPAVSATAYGALEGREADPETLIDEQDTVPYKPTYQNSMYFDEIYHARTGYEHAHSLSTYETTHPPLGKVFMSLCIRAMGMTPFAWRFAGTLTGVLMLPAIYLLALQLMKKTRWAAVATFLFACDCMHFTQTRIATIDSFPVLFMTLMFLFMVRWMRRDFFRSSLPRQLSELALSGIFMGMAIASKWIGCYGAVGLALLFFSHALSLLRQYQYAERHRTEDAAYEHAARVFPKRMLMTILCCVIFFVVVPLTIYILSYIPYLSAYGRVRFNAATFRRIWDAQVLMFDYHANLVATHYFASPWYEWPLIIKPMWYYTDAFPAAGKASTILAFGNPAVWWSCLVGILFILGYSIRRNLLPTLGVTAVREDPLDRMMPVVVIGFLSAYLPWVLVSRLTFIYHYFASVPFIILGTCMMLMYAERHRPRLVHIVTAILCILALVLFAAFYPLASGHEVPRAWCDAMNWFGGWMWY